jgi:hypothetical protein
MGHTKKIFKKKKFEFIIWSTNNCLKYSNIWGRLQTYFNIISVRTHTHVFRI